MNKVEHKIVIDFSDSAKEVLLALAGALATRVAPVVNYSAAETPRPIAAETPKPAVAETPKPAETPTVDLTALRTLINEKAGENKTEQILALLKQYGAKSASSLGAEHYGAFYEALKKL